jgi:phosphatidylinositol-3-phosphatase
VRANAASRLGLSVAAATVLLALAPVFRVDRDPVTATARATVHAARVVPRFGHAIVVVFENHSARRILDRASSPFLWLARHNALLAQYDAVAHPSLPNYLALISGWTYGVHHDCTSCSFAGPSLATTLAQRGLSWRMYVEHLPLYLSQGAHITGPEKARLPFLYFRDANALEWTKPLSAFFLDLRLHQLPSFSLVIPDLCHDMHSCSIAKGDVWMHSFLRALLRPGDLARTAVFVVFDEGKWIDKRGGGGRVAAIVAGPLVRPHSVSNEPLDHYSLLRTIEDSWGLPALGRSAWARPITGIWRHP